MASNDLEKFRTEWKNELQGSNVIPDKRGQSSIAVAPTLAIDIVLPENISNTSNSNPTNCSECRVHPAFRENNKCHTCLFVNNKQNKEHKTNTQFYPFQIVDGLLNSKDNIKQSCSPERELLSNTKVTSTCEKKRKYDAFRKEDAKDIFSNKQGRKEVDKESYLDLFIADLVRYFL